MTYSILLLQKGTKENEFIGAQGTNLSLVLFGHVTENVK